MDFLLEHQNEIDPSQDLRGLYKLVAKKEGKSRQMAVLEMNLWDQNHMDESLAVFDSFGDILRYRHE